MAKNDQKTKGLSFRQMLQTKPKTSNKSDESSPRSKVYHRFYRLSQFLVFGSFLSLTAALAWAGAAAVLAAGFTLASAITAGGFIAFGALAVGYGLWTLMSRYNYNNRVLAYQGKLYLRRYEKKGVIYELNLANGKSFYGVSIDNGLQTDSLPPKKIVGESIDRTIVSQVTFWCMYIFGYGYQLNSFQRLQATKLTGRMFAIALGALSFVFAQAYFGPIAGATIGLVIASFGALASAHANETSVKLALEDTAINEGEYPEGYELPKQLRVRPQTYLVAIATLTLVVGVSMALATGFVLPNIGHWAFIIPAVFGAGFMIFQYRKDYTAKRYNRDLISKLLKSLLPNADEKLIHRHRKTLIYLTTAEVLLESLRLGTYDKALLDKLARIGITQPAFQNAVAKQYEQIKNYKHQSSLRRWSNAINGVVISMTFGLAVFSVTTAALGGLVSFTTPIGILAFLGTMIFPVMAAMSAGKGYQLLGDFLGRRAAGEREARTGLHINLRTGERFMNSLNGPELKTVRWYHVLFGALTLDPNYIGFKNILPLKTGEQYRYSHITRLENVMGLAFYGITMTVWASLVVLGIASMHTVLPTFIPALAIGDMWLAIAAVVGVYGAAGMLMIYRASGTTAGRETGHKLSRLANGSFWRQLAKQEVSVKSMVKGAHEQGQLDFIFFTNALMNALITRGSFFTLATGGVVLWLVWPFLSNPAVLIPLTIGAGLMSYSVISNTWETAIFDSTSDYYDRHPQPAAMKWAIWVIAMPISAVRLVINSLATGAAKLGIAIADQYHSFRGHDPVEVKPSAWEKQLEPEVVKHMQEQEIDPVLELGYREVLSKKPNDSTNADASQTGEESSQPTGENNPGS